MKTFKSILVLIYCLATVADLSAAEFIKSFDSKIEIGADAKLTITETIVVNAEGRDIKRGIYRDFPTQYTDSEGVFHKNTFGIISVKRNGSTESYHLEATSNGVRIYFGNSSRMLSHGEHSYSFKYRTTNQLRFFTQNDELYWNVTGNEWVFPIEKATATVTWPENIDPSAFGTNAFTGRAGSREQQYQVLPSANQISFQTTAPLPAYAGFTIAVNWPKGLIAEPAGARPDDRYLHMAYAGLGSLLAYYLLSWFRKGKGPAKRKVKPQFMPDFEHSPAAVRYVNNMAYDSKAFTASIINMAVKGYLKITEDDGKFSLERIGEHVKLTEDERRIRLELFRTKDILSEREDTTRRVKIDKTSQKLFSDALSSHEQSLVRDYEEKFFKINEGTHYLAQAITWVSVFLLFVHTSKHGNVPEFVVSLFVMAALTIMVVFVLPAVIRLWRGERTLKVFVRLFFGLVIPTLFVMGIFGITPANLISMTSLRLVVLNSVMPFMLTLLAINTAFYYWMKAPTELGREMLDKMDSFKFYLKMANKGHIEFDEELRLTPENYDRYLPYAMALNVETEWGDYLHKALSKFGNGNIDAGLQQPDWYDGDRWQSDNFTGFTRKIGSSMSRSISSSAVAPFSSGGGGGSSSGGSSGFGGGGSSGGGGGGGGGGGW